MSTNEIQSESGPSGEHQNGRHTLSEEEFVEIEAEAFAGPDAKKEEASRASLGSLWGAVRESPRGVLLLWCLWLLGSWLISLSQVSSAVAVRLMVVVSALGLMLIWPLFRLSESPPRKDDFAKDSKLSRYIVLEPPKWATRDAVLTPGLLIFSDWLSLILVFQAVVWPLRLTAGWGVLQTAWLDLTVVVWTFLIAAIVAIVCRTPRTDVRTFGMILCVLLVFGEPAYMLLLNMYRDYPSFWQMQLTPIAPMWAMSTQPLDWDPGPWKVNILLTGLAGCVAWVLVICLRHKDASQAVSDPRQSA